MKKIYFLFALLGCLLLVACNTAETSLHSKPNTSDKRAKTKKQHQETGVSIEEKSQDTDLNAAFGEGDKPNETTRLSQVSADEQQEQNKAGATQNQTAKIGSSETISFMQADDEVGNRATASRVEGKSSKPVMVFDYNTVDFGTIVTGSKVQHSFAFTNTGAAPLIIHEASGSCGCTIPEIPLEPIAPGETGTIVIHYDSAGKIGLQNKTITIQTNASPATHLVYIKAIVVTENMADETKQE